MDRLEQLYKKLGLDKQNGLHFLDESEKWIHKFPYRVGRILKEVIKPDAFFCLYMEDKINVEHPRPFNQGFILFFDSPSCDEENRIHSQVINFGLAQAVFINKASTLDVYHGSDFSFKELKKLKSSSNLDEFLSFSFVNQLLGKTVKELGGVRNLIDVNLLNNITDARTILIASDGLKLPAHVANRLIGRLLFISYLIDRDVTFSDQHIISGKNKYERKEAFKKIISEKNILYKFFKYLTNKYDGDMFPLKEYKGRELSYDEESVVETNHLEVLFHLFNCSSFFKSGQSYKGYLVQKSLFYLYDFEIIPVELISSIYENFIGSEVEGQVKLSKQKEIKAYYTPPYLVDYVLSQTVTPFLKRKTKRDSNCKVLDPACGSGIFLVETLRKIIEKELTISKSHKISDSKLWKLIKNNIYGIDIDSDAIEISIFSLYITILDYKQPAEIENFKFQKLKDENFFGGADADFFNTKHVFNDNIRDLDFIVGNPPWGQVKKSCYIDYIHFRNRNENALKDVHKILELEIGDKEICQAFMVRTSDFLSNQKTPKCCLIISSKVLYNSEDSSKNFRNYFLQKFSIKQVVELSPVNNKIRGGNHIFDHARQPAAIITFVPEKKIGPSKNSVIQHITVKPNKFFLYYKTIVIEKHDVKHIKQEYFIEEFGGFDWLWKVLLHGNALDIHFIKRLKKTETVKQYLDKNGYNFKGGLKVTDGIKKNDSSKILNYDYLDAKLGFRPYSILPHIKWKNYVAQNAIENSEIGYLPDLNFFEGDKLLVKKGIVLEPENGEHYFGGVAAFSDRKICFTSTVCSIKSISKNENSKEFLAALSALFNSKLFTYFLLNTSSSAGVERSRIHFEEFFNYPLVWNNKLADLALEITNKFDDFNNPIINTWTKKKIENEIRAIYKISAMESTLIDYALDVSIPILLRDEDSQAFKSLILSKDKNYLEAYAQIFISKFKQRFLNINKYLNVIITLSEDFIRYDFRVSNKENETPSFHSVARDDISLLSGELGIYHVCKDLYFQQDVRGFTEDSFYIIKPNERKLWHPAVAHLDALEFEEEITATEVAKLKKEK